MTDHNQGDADHRDITERWDEIEQLYLSLDLRSDKPCPGCGSDDVVQIVYGLPTDVAIEKARRGHIVLGGCLMSDAFPGYCCKACHLRW